MTEPRLADYLQHIRGAAQEATSYVSGMDFDAFLLDTRIQKAVMMCLLIIGEAATKIMELHSDFALRHGTIPWQTMRNMRNRMMHGYFNVNLHIVWDTVHDDLPRLIANLMGLPAGS